MPRKLATHNSKISISSINESNPTKYFLTATVKHKYNSVKCVKNLLKIINEIRNN